VLYRVQDKTIHLPNLRRLIFNVHLLIALIAGTFITVLGVTGSIIAFEPELDRLLHPHLSYVAPGGRILSLREIGEAVSQNFGGEPIIAYLPSSSPNLSSEVLLSRGVVCVNQYTGAVLGVRTRGQTFLGFVRTLHIRLAFGHAGRNIMRCSGVAMLFSLVSGLYLWWPIKRIRIQANWRSRRFWFDVHNSVGIFSLLPLFVLTLTGTIIGFEDQAATLIDKLMGPAIVNTQKTAARLEPTPGAVPITPDEAVAIARVQMPGAIPYRVQMPRYGGVYRVTLLYPQDRISGARNLLTVDPYSGNVLFSSQSKDLSARERVLATNEAIHTGDILAMPSRIIASLASAILPLQALSGLLMWLRRNKVMPTPSRSGEGVLDT
jgi:uncharacterized iron-regulated membrane protein